MGSHNHNEYPLGITLNPAEQIDRMRKKESSQRTDKACTVVDDHSHQISGWRCWVLWPLALLLRLWCKTLRFKSSEEKRRLFIKKGKPRIYLFWHNRLFVATEIYRIFASASRTFALVSPSKDGAWLAAFLKMFRIGAVRGSSSRGGLKAMMGLYNALKAGHDVVITPDGPRGPRYQVKPGALWLARETNAQLLLLNCHLSKCWRLKTWDGFLIPKPFSTVEVELYAYDSFSNLGCESDREAALVIEQRLKEMDGGL